MRNASDLGNVLLPPLGHPREKNTGLSSQTPWKTKTCLPGWILTLSFALHGSGWFAHSDRKLRASFVTAMSTAQRRPISPFLGRMKQLPLGLAASRAANVSPIKGGSGSGEAYS